MAAGIILICIVSGFAGMLAALVAGAPVWAALLVYPLAGSAAMVLGLLASVMLPALRGAPARRVAAGG